MVRRGVRLCFGGGGGRGRWPRAEGAGKVQEIDEPIIFHQPGLNLKSNENILAAKSSPHTNRERRYRQNGWNALKGKSFLSSWCRKTVTIKSQVCPRVSVITWDRSSPGLICYSDDENWAEKNEYAAPNSKLYIIRKHTSESKNFYRKSRLTFLFKCILFVNFLHLFLGELYSTTDTETEKSRYG